MSHGSHLLVYVSSLAPDAEARFEVDRQIALAGAVSTGLAWDDRYAPYDWELVKRQIAQADAFLLLLGEGYGATTPTGISYQHRELVHAQSLHKPVYHLTHTSMDGREANDIRLNELRQQVRAQIGGKIWHLKDELTVHARTLVQSWTKDVSVLRSLKEDSAQAESQARSRLQAVRNTPRTLPERKTIELMTQANVYRGGNLAPQLLKLPMKTDRIWRSILPLLRLGTSEDRLRSHMEQVLAAEVKARLLSEHPGSHAVDGVKIERNQFRKLLQDWAGGGFVVDMKQGARTIWSLPA